MSTWRAEISAALATSSGLDDPSRIDTIRVLEELICVATATQASLAVELDESQRAKQAERGGRPHIRVAE